MAAIQLSYGQQVHREKDDDAGWRIKVLIEAGADFLAVVASGRKNVNTASDNVMPAFGTNPNVMCFLDDIFIYLRARANDAVPRGRPAKHEEKPKAVGDAENRCLGGK